MINDIAFAIDQTCHIDIRYFAIKDWIIEGDIIMVHINGAIISSDDLTKTFRLYYTFPSLPLYYGTLW